MRIEHLSWKLIAVCFAACAAGRPYSEGRRDAPPEIQRACELTGKRCSKCHPIERAKLAHIESPAHWQMYVERMRHQPESGIGENESPIIARCLVFQRFGLDGLAGLREYRGEPKDTRPEVSP